MRVRRSAFAALAGAFFLYGCIAQSGEKFARRIFPDLVFEDVLAFKPRIKPSYGCTYIVLQLPADPKAQPPEVSLPDRPSYDDLLAAGLWKPTPDARSTELRHGHQCLVGRADKFDGVGVGGFSDHLREVLGASGAWFASFGGVEGQKLLIYAPEIRLAVWMRFGD